MIRYDMKQDDTIEGMDFDDAYAFPLSFEF